MDAKCYVAMRYWHPFTEEALAEMKRDGVNTLVVVPLYPQFSISTSGSSLRVLQDLFFKVGRPTDRQHASKQGGLVEWACVSPRG